MLEQMRKSSQSLLIYVLFGIVIAVFIISFGPQSRGVSCDGPGSGADHYAAKVAGDVVSTSSFRYGYLFLGGAQYPAQMAKQQRLKEMVMDKLIERELLAQEAQRLGYVVSNEEVEDLIAEAKMIGLGYPRAINRVQKDGKFNYEAFKNFVQYELSLNPKTFIDEQKREILASRVRDLMRAGVKVSLDEVKAEAERKGRQVNLEYVRFSNRRYEPAVVITDAELADHAAKNEAKLREAYEQKKFMYEKVPKELKLREILIKTPTGANTDPARAQRKADQLAARLKAGEPFAKLAAEANDDPAARARAGEIGWKRKGALGLETADDDKLFAAKSGEVVGPFKTKDGLVLLVSEASREGDLPFDKVKLELADEKLRQERAGALAKADAEAALARARAAQGKSLKDLFPAKSDKSDKTHNTDKDGKDDKDDKDDKKPDRALAKAGAPPAADAPSAEETGLFSRRAGRDGAIIEGLGVSNALSHAAFALQPGAPVAGPFEIAGSWVIVRLKERKEPDLAEFDKKKLELQRDAELTKWMEVLTDWSHDRCVEARNAKRILVNRDILRYEDSSDPPPYEPCMPRRMFGG
ncbi:MAG TPA: SurA N-terminal domain-containing protein [Polyangia bacterium]|nr:SurA N-terminal domain-containing protein [Polyangia bacterium]